MKEINRAHFRRFLLSGFSLWVLVCFSWVYAEPTKEIVFIHITDTHDITESDLKTAGVSLARAVSKAKEIRAANPDAIVIFVHSGDFISPSRSSRVFQGAEIVEALNASGIQVGTLGNHEFDYNYDVLKKRLAELSFPIVNANVYDTRTGQLIDGTKRYHIIEAQGVRIAFVGTLTRETEPTISKFADPVRIEEPISEIRKVVDELRQRKLADVVVSLSHLNRPEDLELLEKVPGIDLILGGHEHVRFQKRLGKELLSKVRNDVQDLGVARMRLSHTPSGIQVEKVDVEHIAITRADPLDPVVHSLMMKHEQVLDAKLGQPIAMLDRSYDGTWSGLERDLEKGYSPLADVVGEIFRDSVGADVAYYNAGVISRSNRSYGPGLMREKDLQQLIPFLDPILMIETSGRVLRELIESQLDLALKHHRLAVYPVVSGLDLKLDTSRPNGQRVIGLIKNGQPLGDDSVIRLAVNKYVYQSKPSLQSQKLITPLVGRPAEDEVLRDGLARRYPIPPSASGSSPCPTLESLGTGTTLSVASH